MVSVTPSIRQIRLSAGSAKKESASTSVPVNMLVAERCLAQSSVQLPVEERAQPSEPPSARQEEPELRCSLAVRACTYRRSRSLPSGWLSRYDRGIRTPPIHKTVAISRVMATTLRPIAQGCRPAVPMRIAIYHVILEPLAGRVRVTEQTIWLGTTTGTTVS